MIKSENFWSQSLTFVSTSIIPTDELILETDMSINGPLTIPGVAGITQSGEAWVGALLPSSLSASKTVQVSDFVSDWAWHHGESAGKSHDNQYSLNTPTHMWIHAEQVKQARGAYKQITESQG